MFSISQFYMSHSDLDYNSSFAEEEEEELTNTENEHSEGNENTTLSPLVRGRGVRANDQRRRS